MQIEHRAQEVMAYCAQLQNDFGRFRDDFAVVGKHLGNAQSKYAEADRRLDRVEGKLERAADWEDIPVEPAKAEAHELPRAVDAA
jgi:DNA anti-recombination protein RmuC